MTQTIRNSISPYDDHFARGISADSEELSKTARHSFKTFFKSSEIARNYSSTFRQDTEFDISDVYNLLTWRDNWNGYGAFAPKLDAILYAVNWISNFYTLVAHSNWENPNVTAGAQGEVVFEWWNGPKKLTMYISNQSAEYVQVWGPDIYTEMICGDAKSIKTCRELWTWLRG